LVIGPEDVEDFRRSLLDRFPDATEVFLALGVSCQVLINILGWDWYRQNLDPSRSHPFFMNDAADGTDAAYVSQHRVITFGRNLLELQAAPFFDDMVRELRTRSLLGAATELHVARLFHRNGHPVRFVQRTGVKGEDYDQVVRYGGTDMYVEIKAKEDDTAYTASTIRASLRDARQQLPRQGPGIIVIRIPTGWVTDQSFIRDVDPIITGALRNSGRTNAVIVVWDEWLPLVPQGKAYLFKFRIYENPGPKAPVEDIGQLLRILFVSQPGASE
jgi:hypothetical protein